MICCVHFMLHVQVCTNLLLCNRYMPDHAIIYSVIFIRFMQDLPAKNLFFLTCTVAKYVER